MSVGQILQQFIQQHNLFGARTSVLSSLGWALLLFTCALLTACLIDAPFFLQVIFSVTLGLTFILYLFSYVYFMFNDKDALRSEKFSIQKLAIEKGIIGDNLQGVIDLSNEKDLLAYSDLKKSSESQK